MCTLALAGFTQCVLAQDQLFKKDNTKLLVKIIEISPDEIIYKMYDNQEGPLHKESKGNVSLIIYQNGSHEVIQSAAPQPEQLVLTRNGLPYPMDGLSRSDSLLYYRYSNNISVNFLNFFNNELGITYQKDFFQDHFNIIIPFSVGVQRPNITQGVYFDNGYLTLDRKVFDIGFGINYTPSLETNMNYIVGPVFKYMQYLATQQYYYRSSAAGPSGSVIKHVNVSRYCMGITNGVIFRTRSRITLSAYGTLGFKNDVADDYITDPVTQAKITGIRTPVSLYFWCGVNVGFNF